MKLFVALPICVVAAIVFLSVVAQMRNGELLRGSIKRSESPKRFWMIGIASAISCLYVCVMCGGLAIKLAAN